jgi:LacI family transcriptional regulator
MELSEAPTAIFACNDLMAIGALQTLQELGCRVPEDVSLVGFDNIYITTLLDPPLTTIAQAAYQIGELAVDRLMKRLRTTGTLAAKEICLPTEIVVRESTRGI